MPSAAPHRQAHMPASAPQHTNTFAGLLQQLVNEEADENQLSEQNDKEAKSLIKQFLVSFLIKEHFSVSGLRSSL